jgi:hypothetical protein
VIATAGFTLALVLERRFHGVVLSVAARACVPTRTMRNRWPVSVLVSPSSMKK